MIEIVGWVNINISTDGEHESKDLLKTVNELKEYLKEENMYNQFFDIKALNGEYIMYLGIFHNHDNGYLDSVLKILSDVTGMARGSYGLIHARDHDSLKDFNHYKTIRIAKGIITIEKDELLSPCNPKIEG